MTQHACCELPQTRRGHERRVALLLSGTELFLERGYEAVSLDDIVNHAGGSKASIYKYFGSKEGLFKAICDYRRELFFKNMCVAFNSHIQDLRSYLIQTLIGFYQKITCTENAAFMRLVIERSQSDPELALYLHERGPEFVQKTIACALEQAAQQNQIYCPQPFNSAMMYFGILRNIEWKIIMGVPMTIDHQEILDHIEYCVDVFLNGHRIS
ncbi:TetR/AcrR family transcriptional regulator [Acinetobacter sp. S40]|uniref:TetR/AcrR family transcriptional regulator n=1 Tax=unclassified Acinetobacter TaxID=196816 RepID=UPI0019098DC6|nr:MULTISPECIES: TetR/AcrR family transcriptional regulator [unclassified Acinetobacter]MBJ9984477.1 TetR/AcrR family transcriptional regulator [Acinetobacter sp. S40]MBK0062194.1 TetR/AcrR family transcriptional regulator [Acinetobacter sp. S55]MBK0065998.1 TetR/AcrR family transcriptional regulator [Acinetobacter sp. S54]